MVPSSLYVVVLVLLVVLSVLPPSSPCMLQGTDSGFCDTRYHPSHYSLDPTNEMAWLDEPVKARSRYIAESEKFWKPNKKADDGPCMGEGLG